MTNNEKSPILPNREIDENEMVDRINKKRKRCQSHTSTFLYSSPENSRCAECGETQKRALKRRRKLDEDCFKECDHFSDITRFGEDDDCCNGCGANIEKVIESMEAILKAEQDRCASCDYLRPVSKLNYWHKYLDRVADARKHHYRLREVFDELHTFRQYIDKNVGYWQVVCDDCASEPNKGRVCATCLEAPLSTKEEKRLKNCKKCTMNMLLKIAQSQ